MKRTRRRRLILIAVLLAGLASAQVITYVLWAEAVMPVAGLRQLRDTGLLRGSFVWVPRETWD